MMSKNPFISVIAGVFLMLSGCIFSSDEPGETVTVSAPGNWSEIAALLDRTEPSLDIVFLHEAAGDTLAAAQALLDLLLADPPLQVPHQTYSDPVASADALIAGTLAMPPHTAWDLPEDPTWTEDPFDDSNWRFQYHSFRWSLPLIQAFEMTGDTDYLDRLMFLLRDYAETNLDGSAEDTMVWYDMAASMRAETWLTIWRDLLLLGEADVDAMIRFLGWSHLHGEALYHDVPYAAGNNHGSFHSRSLMALGLGLPAFQASDYWFSRGRERFQNQVLDLVSSDGVYLEPSPFYHFYMMGTFRSVRRLLQTVDLDVDADARERLDLMPRFAAEIVEPMGLLPMLSDCPAEIALSSYSGFSEELDYTVSGGVDGSAPTERFRSYPESGYTIFRSGWGEERDFDRETHVVFDVGPLGGWHGHRDALSFTFAAWGSELIVDSGYYTFEGTWRQFFLGPEAHNMVLPADGWSGPFPDPRRLAWNTVEDWAFRSGALTLPTGGEWTRSLVFLAPDDLLVLDRVEGGAATPLDQRFHFHPDAVIRRVPDGLGIRHDGVHMELHQAWPTSYTLVSGLEDPIEGWYSPAYGEKEPGALAKFRISAQDSPRFATLLHAHDGTSPALGFHSVTDDGEIWEFVILRDGGEETVGVNLETGDVVRSR